MPRLTVSDIGPALPYLLLSRGANQAIASATNTVITWDTEVSDRWNLHSAGVITIPAGLAGLWHIDADVFLGVTPPGASTWQGIVLVNGVQPTGGPWWNYLMTSAVNFAYHGHAAGDLLLNAADQVTLRCFHNAGGTPNMNGRMSMRYIGPAS